MCTLYAEDADTQPAAVDATPTPDPTPQQHVIHFEQKDIDGMVKDAGVENKDFCKEMSSQIVRYNYDWVVDVIYIKRADMAFVSNDAETDGVHYVVNIRDVLFVIHPSYKPF